MKHPKKKRRSRASKQVGGSSGPHEEKNEESKVVNSLTEAFEASSLEEATTAYREAKGDPNKAAVILGGLLESADGQNSSSCSSLCGSSSSSSCTSEVFAESNCGQNMVHGKGFRGKNKSKKVVAATGTVSTLLLRDYVVRSPRRDSAKSKGYISGAVNKEDAEQFLCSMLGDDCDLSMAVVRDVLCQCGYDVEKALNALLELSAYEQSHNGQSSDCSANSKEDCRSPLEFSDNLTDRASDTTSHSSESELLDNMWPMGYRGRNYYEVLIGSEVHSPPSPRSSESELPQKVLDSLFNISNSTEHEPNSMNWKNVVKKMESLGQRFEFHTSGAAESQELIHAKGDDYQMFRKSAMQHWDSMKSYYQKATSAYLNGEREYAAYLSDQGRSCNKMAREADEKASQEIFRARNKSIQNVITIDLHGQHVKQAMRLLKVHLLFGAYACSVQSFRVITGCGSHGVGKSKLKQAVINLVQKEGIECNEENKGTLLIRLDGQREFSFLETESDSE
ncbi:SMR domain-containing protein At5g58720 [Cornus florida]|uniref:SMR domain-containing protein At5g58720 n=1 Tax=Cornus florida TaxID=4283 RepID=UPI00289C99A0|nr:SMR domain-containing protein At5g58720 [Cornus florida]